LGKLGLGELGWAKSSSIVASMVIKMMQKGSTPMAEKL